VPEMFIGIIIIMIKAWSNHETCSNRSNKSIYW